MVQKGRQISQQIQEVIWEAESTDLVAGGISVQKSRMTPRLLASGSESVAIVDVGAVWVDTVGGAVWVDTVGVSLQCLWDSVLELISGH